MMRLPFGSLHVGQRLECLHYLVLPFFIDVLLCALCRKGRGASLKRAEPVLPEALALDRGQTNAQTLLTRETDERP